MSNEWNDTRTNVYMHISSHSSAFLCLIIILKWKLVEWMKENLGKYLHTDYIQEGIYINNSEILSKFRIRNRVLTHWVICKSLLHWVRYM